MGGNPTWSASRAGHNALETRLLSCCLQQGPPWVSGEDLTWTGCSNCHSPNTWELQLHQPQEGRPCLIRGRAASLGGTDKPGPTSCVPSEQADLGPLGLSLKASRATSPVVQWPRLHAPSVGGPVRSLVGELDPHVIQLKV